MRKIISLIKFWFLTKTFTGRLYVYGRMLELLNQSSTKHYDLCELWMTIVREEKLGEKYCFTTLTISDHLPELGVTIGRIEYNLIFFSEEQNKKCLQDATTLTQTNIQKMYSLSRIHNAVYYI